MPTALRCGQVFMLGIVTQNPGMQELTQ